MIEIFKPQTIEEHAALNTAILDAALDGVIVADERSIIVGWNHAAEDIFGYTQDEAIGRTLMDIVIPEQYHSMHLLGMKKFLETGEGLVIRNRIEIVAKRRNGETFPIELSVVPILFKNVQLFTSRIRDITVRKQYELSRQRLVDELNHRVRNTLAVVQGIVSNSLMYESDPKQARDKFVGRIAAFGRAHDILTAEDWASVNLNTIVSSAMRRYNTTGDRISITGPDVKIHPSNTISIYMILHELCTNSEKFGAFSVKGGKIEIVWSVEDNCLKFLWREKSGPPVVIPEKTSFGTKLILRSISSDECGPTRIHYDPEGLRCEINLTL